MSGRENHLGHMSCPCCGHQKAAARLSSKGLAYVVCDACNFQGFARSAASDQHLRDRIKPAAKMPDAAPASEPANDQPKQPAAPAVTQPASAPARKLLPW